MKNCEKWPKFKKKLSILSIFRKEDELAQNVASITRNSHCWSFRSIGDETVNGDFNNSSKLSNNRRINSEEGFDNFGFVKDQV